MSEDDQDPTSDAEGADAADGPAADEPKSAPADEGATTGDDPPAAVPAAAPAKQAAVARPRKRLSRTRGVVAWVLVVLAALMVPLSVMAVWAINTTTNTDRYVATMAPLARDKVITDFVAVRATDKLFTAVQVQEKISHALPKRAAFLAQPLTKQIQGFVQTQMTKLLNSEFFHKLWDRANRRSHAAVVAVLTGKGTPALKKANGAIVDITPVVDKVVKQLDAKGITIFNVVQQKLAKANTLTVNLVSGQQISKARGVFRLVTDAGWALPLLTVVLIAAAVAIATDRRKTLLRVAVAAGLVTLIFLAAIALGRSFFVSHASAKVDPAVTTAAFKTIMRYLVHGLKLVVLACVVVALALWLAGPSSWARWIRAQVARGARWLWLQAKTLGNKENRGKATTGAKRGAAWTLEHQSGMRIAGAVVAGIVILFGGNLSVAGVWNTALLLAIYLGLLQVVIIWARRTAGAATRDGDPGDDDAGAPAPADPPAGKPKATVGGGGSEAAPAEDDPQG